MSPWLPPRPLRKDRMPKAVQEWASLYRDGWTLERIAMNTGWLPNRVRRKPGSFSPASIRNELRRWEVPMRKQGGRGSIGSSISVRVADLEERVKTLERQVGGLLK